MVDLTKIDLRCQLSRYRNLYLAAGVYRSPDGERPIMALVSCFVMTSEYSSAQTAITGLLEIHERRAEGIVQTRQLDAGPAVLVKTSETVQLKMGQPASEEYELVKHAITAWIPDPLGNGIVALTVSSNNPEDWTHVRELALAIFDAFLWQSPDNETDQ